MSVYDKLNEMFPDVNWTGGSGIHRSHCMQMGIFGDFSEHPDDLIVLLSHGKFPEKVLDYYQEVFPDVEWLLTPEDFRILLLLDVHRHLHGQGDSFTDRKLINPHTGNKFHRLAIMSGMVGGIRFWVDQSHGKIFVGWRFRWEAQGEDPEDIRITTRSKVKIAKEEWETLMEHLPIPEPTQKEVDQASAKVWNLHEPKEDEETP